MFAEAENAALGSMSTRRPAPKRRASAKQMYISSILADARGGSASSETVQPRPVPGFSDLVSSVSSLPAGHGAQLATHVAAAPSSQGSHFAQLPASAAVPDPHTARQNVLARMRRVPSGRGFSTQAQPPRPPGGEGAPYPPHPSSAASPPPLPQMAPGHR